MCQNGFAEAVVQNLEPTLSQKQCNKWSLASPREAYLIHTEVRLFAFIREKKIAVILAMKQNTPAYELIF